MLRRFTIGQVIIFGLIVIAVICTLLLFGKGVKKANEPKEVLQNTNVVNDGISFFVNGNYVTYLKINEEYTEEGVTAYVDGVNKNDEVIISYFENGKQVSQIDTSKSGVYKVKYELDAGGLKQAMRILIISDDEDPHLVMPETVTITSAEARTYDVKEGVIATDNSGKVSFSCENTLKEKPGDYVIKCRAVDSNGNITELNRLIKVVEGILFEYQGGLKINFPKDKNYTYMYSLDGGKTFTETSDEVFIGKVKGNVIALVLADDNYVMSETYYVK